MKKALGLTLLSLGLLVPMSVTTLVAQEHHDMPKHEWNDGENDAWHRYLKEHNMKDREWSHATKRQQANYWKWRDKHPDTH